jgi:hypothetical protein
MPAPLLGLLAGSGCGRALAVRKENTLGGQDQLSAVREPQPVLAAVMHDYELATRAEQRLAGDPLRRVRALWRPYLGGYDHMGTIIILIYSVKPARSGVSALEEL